MLRKGDEHMHYSDSSHRWIAPPDIEQSVWDAGLRAHLSLHLTTMGGPVEVDGLQECRPPYVPRQRRPVTAARWRSGAKPEDKRPELESVRDSLARPTPRAA